MMADINHVSLEHTFSQAEFARFARLSGDDNPIHVDPEFASQSRFGQPVAHGLLLCSMLRGLVEQLLPGARLLEQSVIFEAPTFAGEPMRFSARVTRRDNECTEIEMAVMRLKDGVATCRGRVVA